MISVKEIAWAAGFLEGEGSFTPSRSTPCIQAVQKQDAPLRRLRKMFGGRIFLYPHRTRKGYGAFKPHVVFPDWRIHGRQAAAIMMTIYAFMSPRRKAQIRTALRRWKAGPGRGNWLCRKVRRVKSVDEFLDIVEESDDV